ncbi:MAG: cyclic pyranopterin monophosphate synthase MoaC [Methanomassiliicoccales archaeon]
MSGMVDISEKPIVRRKAVACGKIVLTSKSLEMIVSGKIKKGDVFETAKISAIQAAKDTWHSIPYCHPIPIESIDVSFEIGENSVSCCVEVQAHYKTGVEMEALAGVTGALLTIWDMVKYIEKDEKGQYPFTRITDIRVLAKEKEE